jgi:hypothetical protein
VAALGVVVCLGLLAGRNVVPEPPPKASTRPVVPSAEGGVASSVAISVQALRGKHFVDLSDAVPIRSGDKLRVRLNIPADMRMELFLLDSEGKLQSLWVEPPQKEARVVMFPAEGKAVPLQGPPGTEVFLACGTLAPSLPKDLFSTLLEAPAPWPKLPDGAVLKVVGSEVRPLPGRSSRNRPAKALASAAKPPFVQRHVLKRGLGPPVDVDDPESVVRDNLEQIANSLPDRIILVGMAFCHESDTPVQQRPGGGP